MHGIWYLFNTGPTLTKLKLSRQRRQRVQNYDNTPTTSFKYLKNKSFLVFERCGKTLRIVWNFNQKKTRTYTHGERSDAIFAFKWKTVFRAVHYDTGRFSTYKNRGRTSCQPSLYTACTKWRSLHDARPLLGCKRQSILPFIIMDWSKHGF